MAQESYRINLMGLSIFLLLLLIGASPAAGGNAEDHVFLQFNQQKSEQERCDIFMGEWVYDPSFEPPYTGTTCDFMDEPQNCQKNRRPDETYLHWRWQPYGCDLPSFDPVKFLKAVANKSLGGIGDSVMRNQLQSLVCLLSQVEKPVLFASSLKWYFPSNNFTVEHVANSWLLKAKDLADLSNVTLRLDVLDDWTSRYHDFDYVLIGDGAWFDKQITMVENDTVVGCTHCQQSNVPHIRKYFPFRKAINQSLRFITAASDHSQKPEVVIFRSQSPNHFEYGHWDDGGLCNRTLPFNGIRDIPDELTNYEDDRLMQSIVKEEFAKAMAAGNKNGIHHLQLLDIYYLSVLRPDGHPSRYRKKGGMDCLHWCLPGVADTWNDLLMAMLLGHEDMKKKPL